MTVPFYVSPEQLTKDRSDFARAGVARGRAVVVVPTVEGMALATVNPSRSLHKIAELYDRIAFAGVGKYNEFEALRRAGVRYADLRGYAYDRVDVDARGLAGAYAETLGEVFTGHPKPFEVELALAEVGNTPDSDRVFRIGFDGSVQDDETLVVIGGRASEVTSRLRAAGIYPTPNAEPPGLGATLRAIAAALAPAASATAADDAANPRQPLSPAPSAYSGLECALLDRTATARSFRRLAPRQIAELATE
ncbi:MAG: proteasome subunit alpha [Bifidobacteriaceae bacterium]|jgi:proteasome alpha subunit|nr:proteasome subunit alpha [Bifidobacteriaceae bacterium]